MPKLHWAHSVDRLPMCKPVEFWDTHSFSATTDESSIDCEPCKRLLAQMLKELGEETNGPV